MAYLRLVRRFNICFSAIDNATYVLFVLIRVYGGGFMNEMLPFTAVLGTVFPIPRVTDKSLIEVRSKIQES